MAILSSIHKKPNLHRSLFDYPGFSTTGKLFGWTPEQMGWPIGRDGVITE